MNASTSPLPPTVAPASVHDLVRLEKLHRQICADLDTLRSQEENLRAYENRLRGAGAPTSAGTTGGVPGNREELAAAWEKFQRAQALLEAERRALTDERMTHREMVVALQRRESELKRRESWLAQREAALVATPPAPRKAPSGLRLGFGEVPFADLFRSDKKSA